MKTINKFLIAGFVISALACNNLDNILSANDVEAIQAMEEAYNNAVSSNNALASYVDETGITNGDQNYDIDDMFHQYDSMFQANHEMYSHTNKNDDHDGNSWMMGNGSMSGNHNGVSGHGFDTSYCSWNNLDLMDSLMEVHEQDHPTN